MFEVATRPWSWDASVVCSRSRAEQSNTGSYNIRRINEALGDPAACAAIAGCVPLNLFGGEGTITPEMLAFIQPVVRDESENKLSLLTANLPGDLVEIWAGPLTFADGYEYRKYAVSYTPDPPTIPGQANHATAAPPPAH